jgi:hypothetical protein
MLYGYLKLDDETQFCYSEVHDDQTVDVTVEQPCDMGFNSAQCSLPAYRWSNVRGFSADEIEQLDAFVRNNAPMILRLAREKLVAVYA